MPFNYDSPEQQLRLAAKSGDLSVVKAFLEQGVDIHAAPVSGMTAVHLALKYGHLNIVRLLLQQGASISLLAATTLEQVRFLQDNGVTHALPDQTNLEDRRLLHEFERGTLTWEQVQMERRVLRAYERGTLSWEEALTATGKQPNCCVPG